MHSEKESAAQPEKEKEKQVPSFIELLKTDARFRTEVIALLVGVAVLIIYAGQLCQMINSNKISREQFSAENRPWLTFEVLGYPDPKGSVTVVMKNTGKTPASNATDIGARTRVVTGKKEIDAFWDGWKKEVIPPRDHPTMVMSPNSSAQTISTPDGDYTPQGANSEQILVVYGRVDYSGAYAKAEKYWTEFCFEHITRIPTASPWAPCIYHNEMH
jgi:hypothetical protein